MPRRGRPDVSEERISQILDAALRVFSERGFHNARMDDIVAASGLSKGTLYWYFKSKDDLIKDLMRRFFTNDLTSLEMLEQTEGSASTRIMHYLNEQTVLFSQMEAFMPIVYEFYTNATRDEDIRTHLQGYFARYRKILTTMIQQGINSGEFRLVNADDVAVTLSAIIEGVILLSTIDPDSINQRDHTIRSVQLVLTGLHSS